MPFAFKATDKNAVTAKPHCSAVFSFCISVKNAKKVPKICKRLENGLENILIKN